MRCAPLRAAGLSLFLWAIAATPAPAQEIRACIGKNGQTQIVGPTDVCKNGETLRTWNVQGPKGDKGDPGPPGKDGAPGAKGDKGEPGAGFDSATVFGRFVGCVGTGVGPRSTTFQILGHSFSGLSDPLGNFTIHFLPPGSYDLTTGNLPPSLMPSFRFDVATGDRRDLGDLNLTNLMTDFLNCGACGTMCAPGQNCVAGQCFASSPQACSGHGVQTGGICICDPGWFGPTCASPTGPTCLPGEIACSGICKSTSTDPLNCGGCGLACAPGQACVAGLCANPTTCPPGQTMCGGTCVDTSTSTLNCGACFNVCVTPNAAAVCVNSQCTVGPNGCIPGFANCNGASGDGCEINIATNPNHCGACNRPCAPGQSCANGVCVGETAQAAEAEIPLLRIIAAARAPGRYN